MLRVDLAHALRSLARQPMFTAVTMLTLALGMGANTAVFNVLRSVLLNPLPYPNADRLVRFYLQPEVDDDPEDGPRGMSTAGFLDYREQLAAKVSLVAVADDVGGDELDADIRDGEQARRVRMLAVSAEYFSLIGAKPLRGRTFSQPEETRGARVGVVREAIWRNLRMGDAGSPTRTLVIDGVPWTIIGAMPDNFVDPLHGDIEVWIPIDLQRPSWSDGITVIGRLAPGVTLAEVQAHAEVRHTRHQQMSAAHGEDISAPLLVSLHDDVAGPAEPLVLAVMGAVSLLLLITCVNVATLMLARIVAREQELLVRAALGAGRARLMRLVLLESVMLSLGGAALGVVVGWFAHRAMLAIAPAALPRQLIQGYGTQVLLFGAALAAGVGIVLGAFTAWHASRTRFGNTLQSASRTTDSAAAATARRVFVVSEVALAMVLVIGAGLLLRTLDELRRLHLGFEHRDAWTFQVNLPDARYADAERRLLLHRTLQRELAALPAVVAVGAIHQLPATGSRHEWDARIAGSKEKRIPAQHRVISGDYFDATGIRVLAGRSFSAQDGPESPRSAVISQRLARQLFPDGNAIGRRIEGVLAISRNLEVIGVVDDVALTPFGVMAPVVYRPHAQVAANRNWALTQVVRTDPPMPDLPEQARVLLSRIDPELVLHEPRTMEQILETANARQRFAGVLLGTFAALAVLLACLGIYGVLAFGVAQRRRELGVRLALGARSGELGWMVVRGGLALTVAGVLIGGFAAMALGRTLSSLLFEVSATDPMVFTLAPLFVVATGFLASFLPARRAAAVNPVESLRHTDG